MDVLRLNFIVTHNMLCLIFVTFGVILTLRIQGGNFGRNFDEGCEMEWAFTPFQKLNFSINDILTKLSESNIVGKGCSGIVYRVETPMKQTIAVKKLWPIKKEEPPERDLFTAEVQTLGSIRHKNIVRLLGCCDNGRTRLLLFDYICNGSLFGLLHENRLFLDWDARYKIILGVAHGLEYLHHDCIPPIVHRDIKANNILVGPQFEAFLADFGLAKLVSSSECSGASHTIAGSYGYIAPGEHKCFCYSKTTVHFSNVRLRKLSLTSLFCQKVIKNFSAFILLRHSFSLSFGTLKTVCMSLRHSFFYLFISK